MFLGNNCSQVLPTFYAKQGTQKFRVHIAAIVWHPKIEKKRETFKSFVECHGTSSNYRQNFPFYKYNYIFVKNLENFPVLLHTLPKLLRNVHACAWFSKIWKHFAVFLPNVFWTKVLSDVKESLEPTSGSTTKFAGAWKTILYGVSFTPRSRQQNDLWQRYHIRHSTPIA